jgi:UDP-N-acetyl-D-glucosamine dehydrogenase
LRELGAEVDYSDPHVPQFRGTRQHNYTMDSVTLTAETLGSYDCVLLATDHDKYDYELIRTAAKLIVDARGRYREPADHIVIA